MHRVSLFLRFMSSKEGEHSMFPLVVIISKCDCMHVILTERVLLEQIFWQNTLYKNVNDIFHSDTGLGPYVFVISSLLILLICFHIQEHLNSKTHHTQLRAAVYLPHQLNDLELTILPSTKHQCKNIPLTSSPSTHERNYQFMTNGRR